MGLDTALRNVMEWRNAQLDILRHPVPVTWEDQLRYKDLLLTDDCRRFGNKLRMWPVTDGDRMVAWGGFTNMTWDGNHVHEAELSFLADPQIVRDSEYYLKVFTYFLREITRLFFENAYWHGHRLHSETYELPHRVPHMKALYDCGFFLEGVMRDKVVRKGVPVSSIIHSMLRSDYERSTL